MKKHSYNIGDVCYFVNSLNKIQMCEIIKKIVEKDKVLYEVRDMSNWRYTVVEDDYCADDKISLKGKKRK